MKQKLKKVFENAVWWSGVVMVGLVLGVSLQFVRAWTEPTEAPPGGNVGAPINTSPIGQFKQGVLQLLGLTLFNDPAVSGDVTGKVLTAQNAYGAVAWAPGGGCYVSYTISCTGDACCAAGFKNEASAGKWGYAAVYYGGSYSSMFRPPGSGCTTGGGLQLLNCTDVGDAYLCCK